MVSHSARLGHHADEILTGGETEGTVEIGAIDWTTSAEDDGAGGHDNLTSYTTSMLTGAESSDGAGEGGDPHHHHNHASADGGGREHADDAHLTSYSTYGSAESY